jgi:GNAT superfamily N-acetyltransferase
MATQQAAPATPAAIGAVTLRNLRPDEGAVLDTLVARLSPRSRYLRFHSPIAALSPGLRRVLLDVDGHDRVALVAESDDGTPVGIVRTVRDAQRRDEAEIAVAVVDAWHRRGIARRLVAAAAQRALVTGVRRLTARVLPENAAALALFRSVFPVRLAHRDEDALVLVSLIGGADGTDDWTITMDDVLAAAIP